MLSLEKTDYSQFLKRFLIGVLSWGIFLRVYLYLMDPGFLLDEINLARNIAERPFSELFLPLSYEQHAPVLWLLLIKTITYVASISEYTLRFLSLVLGISSLFLFGKILFSLNVSRILSFIGIVIFTFNSVVVRYSLEFKQYGVDLFCSLLMVYLYLNWNKDNKTLVWIGIVGVIMVGFSMPIIFVLGAIIVDLWFKRKANNKKIMVLAMCWVGTFTAVYFLFLKPSLTSLHLKNYHSSYFLDFKSFTGILSQVEMIFRGVFGKTTLAIVLGIGFFLVGLTRKKHILILGLPLLLGILASAFGYYSLIERLMLYAYPGIVLLFVLGMDKTLNFINKPRYKNTFYGFIIISTILIVSSRHSFIYFPYDGFYGENVDAGLLKIKENNTRGPLILTHNAFPFYDYYQRIATDSIDLSLHQVSKLSWDNRELDSLLQVNPESYLFDAHTFGEEEKALEDDLKLHNHKTVFESKTYKLIKFGED